ncbi:MAG: dihydrofolate reductase family protein [Elusimicrobia bacterium]|nr:dihydrofolate reductase family protein [Elusimicrobiota bacterium]
MRKLIATEWMSLDGVVQAPAYADEDTSGGFQHGGWNVRYLDETAMNWVTANVREAGGYVLGRRTYETFAAYWPKAPDAPRTLSEPMNSLPKHVASRTLREPLPWANSRLLGAPLAEAVAALKRENGKSLLAIGSPELVRNLLELDLIDELRLMVAPVILGGGKRPFHADGSLRSFRLSSSRVTGTGAVLVTYERRDYESSQKPRTLRRAE